MQRKEIPIRVYQHIQYANTQEKETYELQTSAIYTELESFTKFQYQGENGEPIEVKLSHSQTTGNVEIEIKQSNATMRFVQAQQTQCLYSMEGHIASLAIETNRISIGFDPQLETGKMQQSLQIEYALIMDDEKLGNYVFRLIYSL